MPPRQRSAAKIGLCGWKSRREYARVLQPKHLESFISMDLVKYIIPLSCGIPRRIVSAPISRVVRGTSCAPQSRECRDQMEPKRSDDLHHGCRWGLITVKVLLLGVLFLAVGTMTATSRTQLDELISRAKSLELDTPYVPPPGDPLVHHAAGYAKVMCSAVFMTGLEPDFAAANVGFFTALMRCGQSLVSP
jgi:hypothetical protein